MSNKFTTKLVVNTEKTKVLMSEAKKANVNMAFVQVKQNGDLESLDEGGLLAWLAKNTVVKFKNIFSATNGVGQKLCEICDQTDDKKGCEDNAKASVKYAVILYKSENDNINDATEVLGFAIIKPRTDARFSAIGNPGAPANARGLLKPYLNSKVKTASGMESAFSSENLWPTNVISTQGYDGASGFSVVKGPVVVEPGVVAKQIPQPSRFIEINTICTKKIAGLKSVELLLKGAILLAGDASEKPAFSISFSSNAAGKVNSDLINAAQSVGFEGPYVFARYNSGAANPKWEPETTNEKYAKPVMIMWSDKRDQVISEIKENAPVVPNPEPAAQPNNTNVKKFINVGVQVHYKSKNGKDATVLIDEFPVMPEWNVKQLREHIYEDIKSKIKLEPVEFGQVSGSIIKMSASVGDAANMKPVQSVSLEEDYKQVSELGLFEGNIISVYMSSPEPEPAQIPKVKDFVKVNFRFDYKQGGSDIGSRQVYNDFDLAVDNSGKQVHQLVTDLIFSQVSTEDMEPMDGEVKKITIEGTNVELKNDDTKVKTYNLKDNVTLIVSMEVPKPADIPKPAEVPKPVEAPKPAEDPKPVDVPKPIDPTAELLGTTNVVSNVEPAKPVEELKEFAKDAGLPVSFNEPADDDLTFAQNLGAVSGIPSSAKPAVAKPVSAVQVPVVQIASDDDKSFAQANLSGIVNFDAPKSVKAPVSVKSAAPSSVKSVKSAANTSNLVVGYEEDPLTKQLLDQLVLSGVINGTTAKKSAESKRKERQERFRKSLESIADPELREYVRSLVIAGIIDDTLPLDEQVAQVAPTSAKPAPISAKPAPVSVKPVPAPVNVTDEDSQLAAQLGFITGVNPPKQPNADVPQEMQGFINF